MLSDTPLLGQSVAELLVQTLKEAELEIVFGLPGGENIDVMEALRREGIRFVLVRHESAAVFMADVYTRLTGKLGVCLTTLGPGATNAYMGVAHAYLDRAPIMIITAETNQRDLPGHTHQVYDLQEIFRPVTKFSASLTPKNVLEKTGQALRLLKEGRPGPVHLSLSRQMATQKADLTLSVERKSQIEPALIDLTSAPWPHAKRPVIVAGVGLEPEQPYHALQALAEAANAPVIVTPKAKGCLSDRHALAAGTLGLTRTDPVYEILDEADCIFAVGFDVVELVNPWDQSAALIWIAPWNNDEPTLPAVAEFVGLMTPILEQLRTLPFATEASWGSARVRTLHDKLAKEHKPMAQPGRILPQTLLQIIRQYLPDETLICTDVGSHKICTALTWPAFVPNRYMLSNGLSAMSFGVTGAIAGAIALNQPTVCITGDAGFSMVIGELSLLTELKLPVIIIIMNDSALDLIRAAQHRVGNPTFGTEFSNPDFGKIAEAYKLSYYRVTDDYTCTKAIQEALALKAPTLIEALIDPISSYANRLIQRR